jgi:hypothetical protein
MLLVVCQFEKNVDFLTLALVSVVSTKILAKKSIIMRGGVSIREMPIWRRANSQNANLLRLGGVPIRKNADFLTLSLIFIVSNEIRAKNEFL